jgi:TPR repeat protein
MWNVFLSPYRCRDCRTRFWVLSHNSYYAAGAFAGFIVIVVLAWHAVNLLDMPNGGGDRSFQSTARLPDLLKLAEKNDPGAEYELAQTYGNGHGVPQSVQEENRWLERAARHGNVQAQYEYGVALRDGHGTVQDYQAALKWIQLAADGNNAMAQFALGQMYRSGLGVPVNNVKAYIWLNVAAARSVPGAVGARDAVLLKLSPDELAEAQAESRRISERQIAASGQQVQ